MFKNRTKNYCLLNKEQKKDPIKSEILQKIFNEICQRRDDQDCDVFINRRKQMTFANRKGMLYCGAVYEEGKETIRKHCQSTHQINPCRTYIERCLLSLFELDHM